MTHDNAALPTIKSVGQPPEKHADRIVAEMLQLITRTQAVLAKEIWQILTQTPDGNPRSQEKLRRKVKEVGGLFHCAVSLEPGKRGRYKLFIIGIAGWDQERKEIIQLDSQIPDKPWLACTLSRVDSQGQHSYEKVTTSPLLVTHHALSRLAQRHKVKTAEDLLIAVNNIFHAFLEEYGDHKTNKGDWSGWIKDGYRLRFILDDTETAAAVLNHYDDEGNKKVVVVTIV